MFVFYGCSYTYGQGLQYYWLVENTDYQWEDMDEFLASKIPQELLPFEAEQYRIQHSYPHLVSKHFGVNYFNTSVNNGGDNSGMHAKLQNLHQFVNHGNINYHIFQFTSPGRNNVDVNSADNVYDLCYRQVERIEEEMNQIKNDNKWLAFSCYDEIGKIIKEEFSDKFIPIIHNDKEHLSFEHLAGNKGELTIHVQHTESGDRHFSDYGHRVIADSIIRKIEQSPPLKFNIIKGERV